MQRKKIPLSNNERLIYKHRGFVTASLSPFKKLQEQKIVNFCLYLITEAMQKTKVHVIHLKISHIRSILGTSGKAYTIKQIKQLFENLIQSNIKIYATDNKKTKYISLFEKLEVDESNKQVSIYISKYFLTEYLQEKNSDYVRVLFSITQKSKNMYTPKIIEFLTQYLTYRPYTDDLISLQTPVFKDLLGLIENKHEKYKLTADFRLYVLEPAKKEASSFGFNFDYELMDKNKKIKFTMTQPNQKAFKKHLENFRYVYNDENVKQDKRKIYEKNPAVVFLNKSDDKILSYTRERTQQDTVQYLKDNLMQIPEFNSKIKNIECGDNWTIYIFKYHHEHYKKYELISFMDLDEIILYFVKPFTRKTKDETLMCIQNIINAPKK